MIKGFSIGDRVKCGKLEGNITAIIVRGNEYKEYECLLISKKGEPERYVLPKCSIKYLSDEKNFGFSGIQKLQSIPKSKESHPSINEIHYNR